MISYRELLLGAAQVIDAHGWQPNRYHQLIVDPAHSSYWPLDGSNSGPHCMVGAMIRALSEATHTSHEEPDLGELFADHRSGPIITANHYRVRSAAEASAWLRGRADQLPG
jgi:hypothetical protein